jgi:hypothetical protein
MNRQEEFEMLKQDYHQTEVPDAALEAVKKGIRQAKEDNQKENNIVMTKNRRKEKKRGWKPVSALAAAALMGLLIVPNVNSQIAMAVSDVPVLNRVVELVTLNRFEQNATNGMYDARVETPELMVQGDAVIQSSAGEINAEVKAYAERMIKKFQQEMAQQGGVYGLDITYYVVTDTDSWFTLLVSTTETTAGGVETLHYYNLDKKSGQYVQLADLFLPETDYITAISEDIKLQMAEQMKANENVVYNLNCEVPEDNFEHIAADQNFYINQDGKLVIVFDEYEVAPGFMGCPEFIIDEKIAVIASENCKQP